DRYRGPRMQIADAPADRTSLAATRVRRAAAAGPASLCGLLAAAVALGLDQLISSLGDGWQSLVVSVANEVKDSAPEGVTRWGIETFGTADKPLLIAGTVVICLGVGALVGPAAARRPVVGVAVFAAFAAVGALAGVTDASASDAGSVIAALLAGAAGAGTLFALLARAPAADVRASDL